jgi:hypothetical protein
LYIKQHSSTIHQLAYNSIQYCRFSLSVLIVSDRNDRNNRNNRL